VKNSVTGINPSKIKARESLTLCVIGDEAHGGSVRAADTSVEYM
jgi:hypothetical protein